MSGWLGREETRRWLDPLVYLVALGFSVAVAFVLGSDNPVLAVLVAPIAVALVNGFLKSLARRPQLSLDAEYGANSTTSQGDVRMASAVVYLFLRNEEGAGEAKHCKVEISEIAPTRVFRLNGPGKDAATEHLLDGDTHTIVWQPGLLPPGGVAELQLRSDQFPFTESVSEKVRVRADRMVPIEATLVLRVDRYDERNAEFSATVE